MGIELKSSSITVDDQVVRVVSDQRVVMGTAYKPDTHIEWVKEDAVNQYTKALLAQLFKGRVKDIRQTTEEVWVKGGKQPVKMAEHILEIGSIKYILTIKNCPQCLYKFKLNITSLKSGEIYAFTIKNGDVYYKQQTIGSQPEVISQLILAEEGN